MSNTVITTKIDAEFTPVAGHFLVAVKEGVVVLQKKLKTDEDDWPWLNVASCAPESMLDVANKTNSVTYRVRKVSEKEPVFKVIMSSGLDGKDITNPLVGSVKEPEEAEQPDMYMSRDNYEMNITLGLPMPRITDFLFGQLPTKIQGEVPPGVNMRTTTKGLFGGAKAALIVEGKPTEEFKKTVQYIISGENDKQVTYTIEWNIQAPKSPMGYSIVLGDQQTQVGQPLNSIVARLKDRIGTAVVASVSPKLPTGVLLQVSGDELLLSGQSDTPSDQLHQIKVLDISNGDSVIIKMRLKINAPESDDDLANQT